MYKRLFYGLLALNIAGTIFLGTKFKSHISNFMETRMHKFQTTESGLAYRFIKKGNGKKPKAGDSLLLHLISKDAYGTILWDSNKIQSIPELVPFEEQQNGGPIDEILTLIKEGDRIHCRIKAEKVMGGRATGNDQNMYVYVELKKIYNKKEAEKYENDRQEKIKQLQQAKIEKLTKERQEQLEKDLELIEQYVENEGLKKKHTVHESASGLRYIITKPGVGGKPLPGNIIKANYIGKTLKGKIFDTNIESIAKENNLYNKNRTYKPIEFKLNYGGVIQGWHEAFSMLNKGCKATLIIPSSLAYGKQGINGFISPNSILIFDVELIDFTKPKKDSKS